MEEHYKFTIETWSDLQKAASIVPERYYFYERKFLKPINLIVHDGTAFIEDVDEVKKDDKRGD